MTDSRQPTPILMLAIEHKAGAMAVGFQPEDADLRTWLEAACAHLSGHAQLSLTLVDGYEMARLNSQFRGKARPTNVLSFPHSDNAPETGELRGDIILCPEVINQEAADDALDPRAHWAHLTVHGFCHIAGYDHMCDADEVEMRRVEVSVLSSLEFPDPYNR